MKILSIDPGPVESAWLVLQDGRPMEFGMNPNYAILARIQIVGVPVVCEMVASYGMPVGAEVFETVRWIGRFEQITVASRLKFDVVYRKDVKMHLCQNMRAKDANIRQALIDKIGPQGTKKSPGPTYGISKDVWSALAVAVTFAETHKEEA